MKRDEYFRCKHCNRLFAQSEDMRDPITGAYQCPDGCKEQFEQPPYESPLN